MGVSLSCVLIKVSSHTARPRALKVSRQYDIFGGAEPVSSHTARPRALKGKAFVTRRLSLSSVSSHTARPRALKAVSGRAAPNRLVRFIPYGSTESTESVAALIDRVGHGEGFIPYGSTESTESLDQFPSAAPDSPCFIPYGSTESTESGARATRWPSSRSVSSHTARPRALKAYPDAAKMNHTICFIPYGSTESTESTSPHRIEYR